VESLAAAAAADSSPDDERFMRLALDEARQGDYAFGAVIVRDGQILARGHNLGKTNGDPTEHGEMVAIRRCLLEHGSAALLGSTLYTTGEPCAMVWVLSFAAALPGLYLLHRCSNWRPR
jgi:tRNA(adenine34) deaminase